MKLLIVIIGVVILFGISGWLGAKFDQFKKDFESLEDDEPLNY